MMSNTGFKDPFGEFPSKKKQLKQSIDVSEVAAERNVLSEGSYIFKRLANRFKYIPITNVRQRLPHEKKDHAGSFISDLEYWQEPLPAYNSAYPNNNVLETKSGHIQEFDDTPDGERINTQHRTGTYEEINAKGSRTVKVIGDNYEIFARNNMVYVKGRSSLTVDGSMHILVLNNAHIEVNGDMTSVVRGNKKEYVSGNYDLEVIGDMKTTVHGHEKKECFRFFSVQSNWGMNLSTAETMRIGAGDLLSNEQIEFYQELRHRTDSSVPRIDMFASKNVFIDGKTGTVHLQCDITTPTNFDNLKLKPKFPPAVVLPGMVFPYQLLENSNIIHFINRVQRIDIAQKNVVFNEQNQLDRDKALEYANHSSLKPLLEKAFDESEIKFVAAPVPKELNEFNELNEGDPNAVSIFPVMNGVPVLDVGILKYIKKIIEKILNESGQASIDWGGDWKGIKFFDVFQSKRTNTFVGEELIYPSLPLFGDPTFTDDDDFSPEPVDGVGEPPGSFGTHPYRNPSTPGITEPGFN